MIIDRLGDLRRYQNNDKVVVIPQPNEKKLNPKPAPTFPTEPKKVENPSLKPDGKHRPKRRIPKGQAKLPW